MPKASIGLHLRTGKTVLRGGLERLEAMGNHRSSRSRTALRSPARALRIQDTERASRLQVLPPADSSREFRYARLTPERTITSSARH
jgi:hypothetical protein